MFGSTVESTFEVCCCAMLDGRETLESCCCAMAGECGFTCGRVTSVVILAYGASYGVVGYFIIRQEAPDIKRKTDEAKGKKLEEKKINFKESRDEGCEVDEDVCLDNQDAMERIVKETNGRKTKRLTSDEQTRKKRGRAAGKKKTGCLESRMRTASSCPAAVALLSLYRHEHRGSRR